MTADPVGGVWTYCMELIRALEPLDTEVVLASMGGPVSKAQCLEVETLSNAVLYEKSYSLEWMEEPWDEVDEAGEWLLDLARRTEPDYIHLNGYSHAALPWQVPVLIVAHSCVCSWWKAVHGEEAPRRYDTYRMRVQAGLSDADFVVAPTRAMLMALHEVWDVGADKTCVIWNGRHPARFTQKEKDISIFSAGRIWDPAKNIELLDGIAPALETEIVVAGDSRVPSGGMRRLNNVRALGCISGQEMSDYLARASLYVSPARYEPFGLSILEAALSGCALVLSDLPSFRELWGDAALYVPNNQAEEWKQALHALIPDRSRCERMGMEARSRGLRYTPERMARSYEQAYSLAKSRFDSKPRRHQLVLSETD
jgi:glycogen(starch) synthase